MWDCFACTSMTDLGATEFYEAVAKRYQVHPHSTVWQIAVCVGLNENNALSMSCGAGKVMPLLSVSMFQQCQWSM